MSNQANCFYAAVSVLASHGDIKQRLVKAYEENLAFIEEEDLLIAVKQSFADLRHIMSRVDPVKAEGRIRASVRKMSVDEADECAQDNRSLRRHDSVQRQRSGAAASWG